MAKKRKFGQARMDKILAAIREDSYTVAELCKIAGISERSYYYEVKNNAEFAEEVRKAEDDFDNMMTIEAKRSLRKLVKGYTAQEKRTVTADTGKKDDDGKPIVRVKEHVVTEKHYQPNTGAVIFTLTNRDPDKWKNRLNSESNVDVSIKSDLEKLSDEELLRIIDDEQ